MKVGWKHRVILYKESEFQQRMERSQGNLRIAPQFAFLTKADISECDN
jgi:hypothetical protein